MDAMGEAALVAHRMVEGNQADASATHDPAAVSGRIPAFDHLRASAVVLVLFVHATLAYTAFASFDVDNPIASTNPVVDEERWVGFDLIVAFNETFLMPLLFLISGIFVWRSLARKGAWQYFGDRLKRLGMPFVVGLMLLIPLAYYPSQLEAGLITGKDASYGAFWLGMVRSGFGTAGPLWFLWLLLTFNGLAALLYRATPLLGGVVRGRLNIILGRPVAFCGMLLGISMIVYPPLAIALGPLKWIGIGPFHAQAGRILLYLVYFLAGTAVGAIGIERTVFKTDGAFAKRWWAWSAVGLMSFAVFVIMVVVVAPMERTIVSEIAFAACCCTIVLGMTGLFLRHAGRLGHSMGSLRESSYGIYIVHYVFNIWLQYLFLGSSLPPQAKGIVVFAGTLVPSWVLVASIRRIPAVAKYV